MASPPQATVAVPACRHCGFPAEQATPGPLMALPFADGAWAHLACHEKAAGAVHKDQEDAPVLVGKPLENKASATCTSRGDELARVNAEPARVNEGPRMPPLPAMMRRLRASPDEGARQLAFMIDVQGPCEVVP